MTEPRQGRGRLLVSKAEAAELLSISIDSFERLVMPEVRIVRVGRRVLFAVGDLERATSSVGPPPRSALSSSGSPEEGEDERLAHTGSRGDAELWSSTANEVGRRGLWPPGPGTLDVSQDARQG